MTPTTPPKQKPLETKPGRVIPKEPVTETDVSRKSDLAKKPADPSDSEHGSGVETHKPTKPKPATDTKKMESKVQPDLVPMINQLHSNMALSA